MKTLYKSLVLRTGTATALTYPVRFPIGVLLTTPVAGVLENNTSGLFYTTLGDRRSLLQGSQPIVATTTVADTLTETVLYTTTLAANELIAGETIWTHIFGYMSTQAAGGGDTCTIRTKIGGTTILTNVLTGKHVTNEPISVEPVITVRTVGNPGTVFGYSRCEITNLGYTTAGIATVDINTTAVSDLTITCQWGTAHADDTLSIVQGWSTIIW